MAQLIQCPTGIGVLRVEGVGLLAQPKRNFSGDGRCEVIRRWHCAAATIGEGDPLTL